MKALLALLPLAGALVACSDLGAQASDAAPVATSAPAAEVGLVVGDYPAPIHSLHVAGPDKGEEPCLICSDAKDVLIQAWVKDLEAEDLAKLIEKLDDTAQAANSRAYITVLHEEGQDPVPTIEAAFAQAGREEIGVAVLPITDHGIKQYNLEGLKPGMIDVNFIRKEAITAVYLGTAPIVDAEYDQAAATFLGEG